MQNVTKLKEADEDLAGMRVGQDLNTKERDEIRALVQQAKNLTEMESGDYIHIVRRKTIIRVKARHPRPRPNPQ
jgi:hypothetical protein